MLTVNMHLSSLSNLDLHRKTVIAAETEKFSTLDLLEYLQEVDHRRLYAERGYESLWMYVHRELGYSEAQTSERVGAMRLIAKVPEVKNELKENKLSLTTAAKLASFSKKEKLVPEKIIELLHQISDQPKRVVEKILFANQEFPEARPDFIKRIGIESSRISFDVDEEFALMLTRLKKLQNDSTLTLQALFKKTMGEYILKREIKPKQQRIASRPADVKGKKEPFSITDDNIVKLQTRHIPISVKNFVRIRSQDRCEYNRSFIHPETGILSKIRCEASSQLQFDHQIPFALGGTHQKENIRHLCRTHNLYAAEKIFGTRK